MKLDVRTLVALSFAFATISCSGGDRREPNPLIGELGGKICQVYDEASISHAKASSELGAWACLGYLHGRDRAWQMDFLRRIAEGKKSEILGLSTLRDDLQMRLLAFGEKAEALWGAMSDSDRAPLWAYAHGVNEGFKTARARDAYEFKHYGYEPEDWRPIDSLEILLLQSFDQTRQTFMKKLDEFEAIKALGPSAAELFSQRGLPWETTILKDGEVPKSSQKSSTRSSKESVRENIKTVAYPRLDLFPITETGIGSNNWAIAPQRSATGHALFANDPHLELKRPSFWYWAHIEGGKLDVIGATLPGAPFVASGSNRHLAWGLTNSYFDVTELAYIPTEDLKGHTSTFYPWVWFRFKGLKLPFFFKGFQRTDQGLPILPVLGGPKDHALVLRWTGFDVVPASLRGLMELMTSETARDADLATSHIGLPSWNIAFADTRGAIGFRTVGLLPKRSVELPFGIPIRHYADWAPWTFLSPDEAPHVLQPARGYLATANNQQWPPGAMFAAGRFHKDSFRAFRIEELLKATPKHDVRTIQKIQCDQQAIDARFLREGFVRALEKTAKNRGVLSQRENRALDVLKTWDLQSGETCRACGLWARWIDRTMAASGLNRDALYRMTATTESGSKVGETVLNAFQGALDDLEISHHREVPGEAPRELPRWGQIHQAPFPHFSGDSAFAVTPLPTGGGAETVSPGTAVWNADEGKYFQTSGPSQRLIVELSDPPVVHSILAGTNLDVDQPNLADPDGPWMKWKNCTIERRKFPLDWSKVQSAQVPL